MKLKVILIPALALFLICLAAGSLLGFTNSITAERIEEQAALAITNSLKEVVSEVDGKAVADFSEKMEYSDTLSYYEAKDENGSVISYIFTSFAKGYGGDVTVMTAYDLKGTIVGFLVVDCANETPGLGQNAKTHFFGLFDGKSGELEVNKFSNDGQYVQAITAATITSKAVVSAVNQSTLACSQLLNLTEEAK